jgi:restriction system protein
MGYSAFSGPIAEWEVAEFLLQCPFEQVELSRVLRDGSDLSTIELSDLEFFQFTEDVLAWASNNSWLGADDWPLVLSDGSYVWTRDFIASRQIQYAEVGRYDTKQLEVPENRTEITRFSPVFPIIQRILNRDIALYEITPRDFEILVADLLVQDGYKVDVGRGTKDGGVDIIAVKDLGISGMFKAVWQAKRNKLTNKVGISVIRELADVRNEHQASKAIIVTTSFLTRGALARVRRDQYVLGKVDRDDLLEWMERLLNGRK